MAKGQSTKRSRQIIRSFEAKSLRKRSFTTRLADSLTKFFGSIGFLILNLAFFTIWIIVNSGNLLGGTAFDPYPYVLLITFVSLEAIVLTVIVGIIGVCAAWAVAYWYAAKSSREMAEQYGAFAKQSILDG